jgi:non-homologous end joining protein Ku
MARSMWKGAISFGLVHIPVEMYPAASDQGLDLTMLDRRADRLQALQQGDGQGSVVGRHRQGL